MANGGFGIKKEITREKRRTGLREIHIKFRKSEYSSFQWLKTKSGWREIPQER